MGKNQNYAFMQLKGNAEMRGMIPVMFDYVVKYNIQDAEQQQGKAKLKFDARTPANRFEIKSDETFTQTKENPFYSFNTWFLFGGRYVEKMDKTRNFFFDKVNKAQLINKMKIEEEVTLDGQTWYHIKYD